MARTVFAEVVFPAVRKVLGQGDASGSGSVRENGTAVETAGMQMRAVGAESDPPRFILPLGLRSRAFFDVRVQSTNLLVDVAETRSGRFVGVDRGRVQQVPGGPDRGRLLQHSHHPAEDQCCGECGKNYSGAVTTFILSLP